MLFAWTSFGVAQLISLQPQSALQRAHAGPIPPGENGRVGAPGLSGSAITWVQTALFWPLSLVLMPLQLKHGTAFMVRKTLQEATRMSQSWQPTWPIECNRILKYHLQLLEWELAASHAHQRGASGETSAIRLFIRNRSCTCRSLAEPCIHASSLG